MHRAAAKAKDVLPHRGAGAEKEATRIGKEAGAKFDDAVSLLLFSAVGPSGAEGGEWDE